MKILVGNTGLIGQTLKEELTFDLEFNSKNMNEFSTHTMDKAELWLSCLPATKWLVNKNINQDIDNIYSIINTLSVRKYSKIILFSTIDVYSDSPLKSNEDYPINFKSLNYGSNRYLFELLVTQLLQYDDIKIFRLPALFSKRIKKNVLFDLINQKNLDQININSAYQWYNLNNLHKDIFFYSKKYPNEKIFNLFTEPIETKLIVNLFPEISNQVTTTSNRIEYDYYSKYGDGGYISNKEVILEEIKNLIHEISN